MVFSALEGDQYSQHTGVCDLARCPCSHSGGKGFGRSGGTKPTSHLPLPHHTCACLREMTGGSAQFYSPWLCLLFASIFSTAQLNGG